MFAPGLQKYRLPGNLSGVFPDLRIVLLRLDSVFGVYRKVSFAASIVYSMPIVDGDTLLSAACTHLNALVITSL